MNYPSDAYDSRSPTLAGARENLRFSFTGSGSEYFRIWIVNLFLSTITLGIYSAWAKVRRTRYFYGSARVAGANFDYHGNPIAILKGRLIALAGIVLYNTALQFSGLLGATLVLMLALVMPWMLWKSLKFRLRNSSYRGIRFSFGGSARDAYINFLLLPVLTAFSLYLLAPVTHRQLKKFQHENSRYGASNFHFNASIGKFYKVYLIAVAIFFAGLALISLGVAPLAATMKSAGSGDAWTKTVVLGLFAVGAWFWVLMGFPIFLAMLQNLIWNHTQLGRHAFHSDIKLGRMIFLTVTNVIGILLTLGLFTPFAVIRSMKYRIESTTLLVDGNLDEFVGRAGAETAATGEGAADLLDFDLSL